MGSSRSNSRDAGCGVLFCPTQGSQIDSLSKCKSIYYLEERHVHIRTLSFASSSPSAFKSFLFKSNRGVKREHPRKQGKPEQQLFLVWFRPKEHNHNYSWGGTRDRAKTQPEPRKLNQAEKHKIWKRESQTKNKKAFYSNGVNSSDEEQR